MDLGCNVSAGKNPREIVHRLANLFGPGIRRHEGEFASQFLISFFATAELRKGGLEVFDTLLIPSGTALARGAWAPLTESWLPWPALLLRGGGNGTRLPALALLALPHTCASRLSGLSGAWGAEARLRARGGSGALPGLRGLLLGSGL